jgi:hypothetical protein
VSKDQRHAKSAQILLRTTGLDWVRNVLGEVYSRRYTRGAILGELYSAFESWQVPHHINLYVKLLNYHHFLWSIYLVR